MRKYNIILSHTKDDLYTLILKSYILTEEGVETDIQGSVLTNLTLEESLEKQKTFINGNL